MAGIDPVTGRCIRPMPYLQATKCQLLNILPGTRLSSDFTPTPNRRGPHQEDCNYGSIRVHGHCASAEFKQILERSSFATLEQGFEIQLPRNQKFIPANHSVQRSIITLSVPPPEVEIVQSDFNEGKIKLNFCDQSGRAFRYISVTDLGFHDYALHHHKAHDLAAVNRVLQTQEEVFLRIGLSRAYRAPDGREGYWLQANGIYTFPHYHESIRSHTRQHP